MMDDIKGYRMKLLHLTEYEEIIRTIIEQSNNYIREHQKRLYNCSGWV